MSHDRVGFDGDGASAGASLRGTGSGSGWLALALPRLFDVTVHPLALLRRESADELIGVLHSLFRHDLRLGGHTNFLQQARDHLRGDLIAGVVEQLNHCAALITAKRDGVVAEAVGNDERHWSVARLDRSLRGCRRVFRHRRG